MDFLAAESPDILALQETKMQPHQADIAADGYRIYWYSAEKKGYSGTAVFTKREPLSAVYGIGLPEADAEGRAITLEYPEFYFVTVYVPNSQDGLRRLPFRMVWEDAFLAYLQRLDAVKPVIVCGDMNVAHQEIDLKNPDTNHMSAGFSDAERAKMSALIEAGFVDSFRSIYPDARERYSWWSYRTAARSRNAGWRIDYFLVSERARNRIRDSLILADVHGSDHCPVCLLWED